MDVSLTFDPPFNGMTWDMEFFIGKPQNHGLFKIFLMAVYMIFKYGNDSAALHRLITLVIEFHDQRPEINVALAGRFM